MKIIKWVVLFLFVLTFPKMAYGYLDPGTGSLIIQGIIGSIAVAGFTIRLYWNKFKSLIKPGTAEVAEELPTEIDLEKTASTIPDPDERLS